MLNETTYAELYTAIKTACIVTLTDTNGVIIDANQNFCELSGYSIEEVIGKNHNLLKSGEQSQEDYAKFWKKIKSGLVSKHEFCNRAKDGHLFWVNNVVVPIIEPETRTIKAFLSIMTEISTHKKMEEEKSLIHQQLLQIQKMESIGQLASGVAHDFNNILMPIIGFTRQAVSAIEKDNSEKALACLTRVEKSANRAADLVDKMLIYCREKPVKLPTPMAPSLVINEVADISTMLRASLSSLVTLNVKNSLTEKNYPLILIDSSELHQIIMNLIVNARDAIEEYWENNADVWLRDTGQIEVDLSLKQISEEDGVFCSACPKRLNGEYIQISISDTGNGIKPEKMSRIFDPFFTTKEVGKGTGLGLSVVSGVLHNTDAHILVKSAPNQGTTFSLLFPAIHQKLEEIQNNDTFSSITHDKKNNKKLKLCVIDDDPEICDLFKYEFTDLNYVVETFSNSLTALNYIDKNPAYFDAIITDYGMPDLSGLDLAISVLSRQPEIPILICTGYSDKLKTANDLPKGNTFLFKKPVTVSVLHEKIQRFFS